MILIFIFTHIRPLNESEIIRLGLVRRTKQIRKYFSFDKRETTVNKEFKKKMNSRGKFYYINYKLQEFPSIAAALLKYKKHEWSIIAFEHEKNIFQIHCNKGSDKRNVTSTLTISNIIKIARIKKMTSILSFHNHPNPNPSRYRINLPSNQDIISATYRASLLNDRGLNLISFVCERGRPYEYFISTSNNFIPLKEFIKDINNLNDTSKFVNLKLHIERIKSKNIKIITRAKARNLRKIL